MPSHAPMSCQVIYPLDAGGHTSPRLRVSPGAVVDLVNAPVSEWTAYLHPSEAQEIARQVARWLDARTNGAGFLEAMAHAITNRHAPIDMEAVLGL